MAPVVPLYDFAVRIITRKYETSSFLETAEIENRKASVTHTSSNIRLEGTLYPGFWHSSTSEYLYQGKRRDDNYKTKIWVC